MKVFELAKKFKRDTRFVIPRAVFMLIVFCFMCAFFSSVMMALALSLSSAVAELSGGARLGALFLCCLRFVRNQPVALSFLFTGLRQRKARRGAAFFIVPMLLCLALFALITSRFEFFSLPQVESPEALLEYIKNNPDSMRKFLSCFVLLLFLAFVFYFPFTFVWSFVYDKTKQPFGKSLLEGLKFFAARPVHFFAFEFCAHFKLFFLIAVFDVLRVCIYKKNSAEAMLYSFGSLTSFASFALTFYTAASVILSIQFYYEQFNNEDSNKAS